MELSRQFFQPLPGATLTVSLHVCYRCKRAILHHHNDALGPVCSRRERTRKKKEERETKRGGKSEREREREI